MSAKLENYELLAVAIVKQAAIDYKHNLRLLNRNPRNILAEREIQQIEKFFKSKLYKGITSIDGDYIMERIKGELRDERKLDCRDK